MSIFSAAEPEAPIVTGETVLREALYSRLVRGGLPMVASNVPVGLAALDDFARGQGSLPPNILGLLTKEIFGGHIEYNPESGLLRRANREPPKPFATVVPPQFQRVPLEAVIGPPRVASGKPLSSTPAPQKRPGWE